MPCPSASSLKSWRHRDFYSTFSHSNRLVGCDYVLLWYNHGQNDYNLWLFVDSFDHFPILLAKRHEYFCLALKQMRHINYIFRSGARVPGGNCLLLKAEQGVVYETIRRMLCRRLRDRLELLRYGFVIPEMEYHVVVFISSYNVYKFHGYYQNKHVHVGLWRILLKIFMRE